MTTKNWIYFITIAMIAEVISVIAIYSGFEFAREFDDNFQLVIGFGVALFCNGLIVLAYILRPKKHQQTSKEVPISNNYYDTEVVVDGVRYRIGYDSVFLSLQNNRTTGWVLWNIYPDNPTELGNAESDEFKIYMKGVLVYSNK